MADKAATAIWADYTGRTRLTIIKAATDPCTILSELQGKSRAEVLSNWDGEIGDVIGAATTGEYQAAGMSATLVFDTGTGSKLYLTLPAPSIDIMMPDGVTVDPDEIIDIIAACVGELSDGGGNVATAFIAGFLAPSRSDIPPVG